jgi:hypothetical protein
VVTKTELKQEELSLAALKQRRLRIVGSAKLIRFELQSVELGSGDIRAYACIDVAKSRVINEAGEDVTPKSRQDRQTSIADFVSRGDKVLLEKTSPWSGDPLC